MAKSTHASGGTFSEQELKDPEIRFIRPELGQIDRPVEREVDPSPHQPVGGGISSQSPKSVPSPTESNTQGDPSPAPTTENPSNQPLTEEDSSVDSTGTDGQSKPQRRSSRPRKAAPRVRNTEDEFDTDEF